FLKAKSIPFLMLELRDRFPKNDEVALYLGFSYEKQRDFNLAESLYRESLQLNPENPKSGLRLGTVLIKKGRYEDAKSFLESVTAKFPGYAVAWWNLGLLYRELGEMDQAKMALNTASQLDPNNLQIQSVLRSLPGSTSE
ncbi:MAG: tetratricopeptide repeat protein, partial [bacterium]